MHETPDQRRQFTQLAQTVVDAGGVLTVTARSAQEGMGRTATRREHPWLHHKCSRGARHRAHSAVLSGQGKRSRSTV